jgi:subtilisin family serine protease
VRNAAILLSAILLSSVLSGCTGGPANEWAYRMVGLRGLDGKLDGSGMRIAIVDTGIDSKHPSLDHVSIIWRDEINQQTQPYDDVGHGTHVAGIIAGEGGSFGGRLQGYSLKGAAPKVDLIVVKAIGANGEGPKTAVANGIAFAIQNQADVICLSLGANPSALDLLPNDMEGAVNSATSQGILVVASAGNVREGETQSDVKVPANLELVVAVGAVDEAKRVTDFSARGSEDLNQGRFGTGIGGRPDPSKKPELVAPGAKIRGAWKDGDYAIASGTSQAAPFVCGALALLLQQCANLRAQNSSGMVRTVKTELMKAAEKLGGQRTPHDNGAGYGLLRADRLLGAFGPNC